MTVRNNFIGYSSIFFFNSEVDSENLSAMFLSVRSKSTVFWALMCSLVLQGCTVHCICPVAFDTTAHTCITWFLPQILVSLLCFFGVL